MRFTVGPFWDMRQVMLEEMLIAASPNVEKF